ncbi:hypothetical protein AbraIFM66950_011753 [Aspergillus brasiliensis]|nr:hypothetical protein AbraIFM66950_011753 [Aspergillus brasiliensis]
METAPLTLTPSDKAHTHARNAVLETRKSNPVAASEEHDLAAGEFATAAQNSSDKEALRTLHLLEQHHKKLAQILRFQHENPSSNASSGATAQLPAEPGTRASTSATDLQQPPRLSGHPRLPSRESSSIASNLASARGIPAHRASPASPTLTPQQAGAKMTEGPSKIRTSESRLRGTAQMQGMRERDRERTHRTSASARQSWIPPAPSPTDITSQQYAPAEPSEPPRPRASLTEEPFQKFYSTFEGLISKISAPLAFAGLPLGTDPSSTETSTSRKSAPDTKTDRYNAVPDRSAEPDINKLFSRAALQAIKDNTGGAGGTGNTAESFYVVPTTGGTVSYAGILTRAEKEARRSSFEDAADEDFVDARETPPSPELRQSLSGAAAAPMGKTAARNNNTNTTSTNEKFSRLTQNPKTMEELQMENQALRHLSDTLSKRLHMWEVNAQSSSMALQQSLRAMHHTQNVPSPDQPHHNQPQAPSPVTTTSGGGGGGGISSPPVPTTDYDQRIKELEEMVRRGEKELGKVGRENDKLRDVLGRYRERWEKLKEGAKSRRAGATSTATAANAGGPTARPGSSSTRRSSTQQGVVGDSEDGTSKAGGDGETTTTENADTSNGEREGSD